MQAQRQIDEVAEAAAIGDRLGDLGCSQAVSASALSSATNRRMNPAVAQLVPSTIHCIR